MQYILYNSRRFKINMIKFYNNNKLEKEIDVDFTKATIVVYKDNSKLITLYSDTIIKLYIKDIKGIRRFLDKILYRYSEVVYINFSRIHEYNNITNQIRFDNGGLYNINGDNIIDFESSLRSFKITSFYDNDNT